MNQPHEWTESGRELLRVIENEITKSGGVKATADKMADEFTPYYKCGKHDCWFCEMMGLKEPYRYPERRVHVKSDNPYLDRPAKPNPKQIRLPYKNHQVKTRKIDY